MEWCLGSCTSDLKFHNMAVRDGRFKMPLRASEVNGANQTWKKSRDKTLGTNYLKRGGRKWQKQMKGKEVLEDQTLGRKFCERDLNLQWVRACLFNLLTKQQRPNRDPPSPAHVQGRNAGWAWWCTPCNPSYSRGRGNSKASSGKVRRPYLKNKQKEPKRTGRGSSGRVLA
jgi:hypothetical protein